MRHYIPFVFLIIFLASCEKKTYALPTQFPLEVGNAWKFQRVYYEDGEIDSTNLDTLYIAGMFEDYYLFTWRPKEYYDEDGNVESKTEMIEVLTGIDIPELSQQPLARSLKESEQKKVLSPSEPIFKKKSNPCQNRQGFLFLFTNSIKQ